jgi:hypothetical protein
MRFLMLMYPGEQGYASGLPDEAAISAMMKYNEELTNAGVLLSLDGLQPPELGARIRFPGGKPSVTDGPFTEAKEVLGGFWMIKVNSKQEAIDWASKVPVFGDEMIEIRQVFEMADFGIDPRSDLAEQVKRVEDGLDKANQ